MTLPRGRSGGGPVSNAEREALRKAREEQPTLDRDHEAERLERIERLKAKRHRAS